MITADTLYTDIIRRLPSWVTRGLSRVRREGVLLYGDDLFGGGQYAGDPVNLFEALAKDPVYGPLVTLMGEHYAWCEVLINQALIEWAGNEWLDLHAADRGTSRRPAEPDDQLRARLRTVPDKATENALQLACEAVAGVGNVEVFTLRNRFLSWARAGQPLARARRDRAFYDHTPRWGRPVTPKPRAQRRDVDMIWSRAHWRLAPWSDHRFPLRAKPAPLNPFLVSCVLVRPLSLAVHTAWQRRMAWSRAHWGGTTPDLQAYKRLRQAAEETRAAGTHVEIWITNED